MDILIQRILFHGRQMKEQKSTSQIKREMKALRELGKQLAELSPDLIQDIAMPVEVREAVAFAQTMKKGEARRRQIQYIGALMRTIDTEPITQALKHIAEGRRSETRAFHQIEEWRDQLIDGGKNLMDDMVLRFPHADPQRLSQLVRNAQKEKEAQRPPRSSRALFRYLRELSHAPKNPNL